LRGEAPQLLNAGARSTARCAVSVCKSIGDSPGRPEVDDDPDALSRVEGITKDIGDRALP